MLTRGFCVSLCLLSLPAFAGSPTRWTLSAKKALYLQCEGKVRRRSATIPLEVKVVSQNQVYVWKDYENDGQGLNAAKWTCAADTNPQPLKNGAIRKHTFNSQQGEDLTLNIQRNQVKKRLSLSKRPR